jgi:hypothetical protein
VWYREGRAEEETTTKLCGSSRIYEQAREEKIPGRETRKAGR